MYENVLVLGMALRRDCGAHSAPPRAGLAAGASCLPTAAPARSCCQQVQLAGFCVSANGCAGSLELVLPSRADNPPLVVGRVASWVQRCHTQDDTKTETCPVRRGFRRQTRRQLWASRSSIDLSHRAACCFSCFLLTVELETGPSCALTPSTHSAFSNTR